MLIFYFTAVLPFALLSKRADLRSGWQDSQDTADPDAIRAQI
jgi:hypothetical protein